RVTAGGRCHRRRTRTCARASRGPGTACRPFVPPVRPDATARHDRKTPARPRALVRSRRCGGSVRRAGLLPCSPAGPALCSAAGQVPEAIDALRPLPAVDPSSRLTLASCLVRDGRREEASRLLKDLGEVPAELALQTGQVYLDLFEPEEAASLFRRAAVPQGG